MIREDMKQVGRYRAQAPGANRRHLRRAEGVV
jgi:hypothetical protein